MAEEKNSGSGSDQTGDSLETLALVVITAMKRKHITVSDQSESSVPEPKKQSVMESENYLESLPRHILVLVLCGVDHDDVDNLMLVSKTIRKAALIAERTHFAYTTPSKLLPFRKADSPGEDGGCAVEIEAPPPAASRGQRRSIDQSTLREVTVALFASSDDEYDDEYY